MKKIKLLIILFLLSVISVNADMGAPSVITQEVVVANPDGAYCYNSKYDSNGRSFVKTDKIVPFKKVFQIWEDSGNEYVGISAPGYYDCYLKATDVVSKNDEFDITTSKEVNKIETLKAVVLSDGVSLKKGPSIVYSSITTIPKGSIIYLTYNAGTYWYYTEYNGQNGWVSGQDEAIGYDDKAILVYPYDNDIYDNNKKVIGKIPAYTEITDYLSLISHGTNDYYVNYNGIIGSIRTSFKKVNGKIKLTKDAKVYEDFDGKKLINTVKKGAEYDYTLINHNYYGGDANIYIPSLKGWIFASDDYDKKGYEIVGEETLLIKENGYLGENLFGEITKQENSNSNNISNSNLVIICVITAVILSFTIIIIIKLINKKKGK